MEVSGIEYFEWARNHADESIRESIELADLTKNYIANKTYDLVNCIGVGEHIEPEFETIFIDNMIKISKDILILGWGEDKADGSHQHVNPKSKEYIRKKIVSFGFEIWWAPTIILRERVREENKNGAYEWWHKPLTVYKKKKFLPLHNKRFIQGCSSDSFAKNFKKSYRGESLQLQLLQLRDVIYTAVANKKPLNILRFGDGDMYFVNALPVGSARPGARALSINYSEKSNLGVSRRAIFKADIITTEIGAMAKGALYFSLLLEIFYKYFPNYHLTEYSRNWKYNRWFYHLIRKTSILFNFTAIRIILWPVFAILRHRFRTNKNAFPIIKPFQFELETIYGLVASRLIFRMFPRQIMLVGQQEKIEAIKILLEFEEYRNYIGVNGFNSYVGVKAIGAADNEDIILNDIRSECEKNKPEIILLGIGSAKLYVLSKIKEFSNAVVIDIGAGIDALAGVISQDRPYFADWINFKSSRINYSEMDLMDLKNPNRDSAKYQKVQLD